MLNHSRMSCNVAEQCDVERLKQATDNSNIQVLKGSKFVWHLLGVLRGIHSAHSRTVSKSASMIEMLILYVKRTWFDVAVSKPQRWGVDMA